MNNSDQLRPLLAALTETLQAVVKGAIGESEAIAEVVAEVKEAGYIVVLDDLNLHRTVRTVTEESAAQGPEPQVQRGEATPGTVAEDDNAFLRNMGISIDSP
jgi:hypothetical protein